MAMLDSSQVQTLQQSQASQFLPLSRSKSMTGKALQLGQIPSPCTLHHQVPQCLRAPCLCQQIQDIRGNVPAVSDCERGKPEDRLVHCPPRQPCKLLQDILELARRVSLHDGHTDKLGDHLASPPITPCHGHDVPYMSMHHRLIPKGSGQEKTAHSHSLPVR